MYQYECITVYVCVLEYPTTTTSRTLKRQTYDVADDSSSTIDNNEKTFVIDE